MWPKSGSPAWWACSDRNKEQQPEVRRERLRPSQKVFSLVLYTVPTTRRTPELWLPLSENHAVTSKAPAVGRRDKKGNVIKKNKERLQMSKERAAQREHMKLILAREPTEELSCSQWRASNNCRCNTLVFDECLNNPSVTTALWPFREDPSLGASSTPSCSSFHSINNQLLTDRWWATTVPSHVGIMDCLPSKLLAERFPHLSQVSRCMLLNGNSYSNAMISNDLVFVEPPNTKSGPNRNMFVTAGLWE